MMNKKTIFLILGLIIVAALLFYSFNRGRAPEKSHPNYEGTGKVSEIIDGDTLKIRNLRVTKISSKMEKEEKIRLAGIDTEEIHLVH